jgi:hypothetical protein
MQFNQCDGRLEMLIAKLLIGLFLELTSGKSKRNQQRRHD